MGGCQKIHRKKLKIMEKIGWVSKNLRKKIEKLWKKIDGGCNFLNLKKTTIRSWNFFLTPPPPLVLQSKIQIFIRHDTKIASSAKIYIREMYFSPL